MNEYPDPDVSLLPIDVGFDLRLHDMAVDLPPGDVLTVDYLSESNIGQRVTGVRSLVADALRMAGYKVSP